MKKLHRKGRGPKAAIRRFLGGDGIAVGPGYFRVVPAALLGLTVHFEDPPGMESSRSLDRSVALLAETIRTCLQEESKQFGQVVKMTAPWSVPSASDRIPREENLQASTRNILEWSRFAPLDPLPDCFQGEAEDRMHFISLILEGLSEKGHVS